MLVFKRLATTLWLSVGIFFVVFVGTMAVGGGIRNAQLSAQDGDAPRNFNEGYARGLRAGAEFRREYTPLVSKIVLGIAVVGAAGLSFSGVLPWCRRAPAPPPLP